MRALAASAAILSLALCASIPARGADDTFDEAAARALEGFSGAIKRACAVHHGGPVRVAVIDNTLLTTVSPSDRAILIAAIERVLGYQPDARVVALRDRAEIIDILRDLVTNDRVARERAEQAQGLVDVLITIEANERDAQGRTLVRAVAKAVDASCKMSSNGMAIRGLTRAFADPGAFFANAARALMSDDDRVSRVVVMPAIPGIGVINSVRVEQLQKNLVTVLQQTVQSERRYRPGEESSIEIGPYGQGVPLDGWQARLLLDRNESGLNARVEFRHRGRNRMVIQEALFDPNLLPTATDPVLRIVPAKERFRVGEDILDIRIQLLRSARLYCYWLTPAGEAALVYPTKDSPDRVRDPRAEPFSFPRDFFIFGSARRQRPVAEAMHEFFHCVASSDRLTDQVMRLWLDNTLEARVRRGEYAYLNAEMTRRILSSLGELKNRAESLAEVVAE